VAYSDAQKAIAVEIVRRANGTVSNAAISEIREKLGLPDLSDRTIRNWIEASDLKKSLPRKKEISELENSIEAKAEKALDLMFEETARTYLDHASRSHIVNRTSGNAAVTAAAIAVDKMRLLRNLPTEIVQIMPMLVAEMDRAGMNASDVFQAMLTRLKEQNEVKGE
jgi:hypothetical protein